jgi:hypothetical protein
MLSVLDDYATVYQLVKDVYAGSVSGGASAKVREVVQAVAELRDAGTKCVTVTVVAKHCGINKMAASRRIGDAERGGWLVDTDLRKNAKNLEIGEALPEEVGLPSPEAIAEACNSVTPFTVRENDASCGTSEGAHSALHHNGTNGKIEAPFSTVNAVTVLHPLHEGRSLSEGVRGSGDYLLWGDNDEKKSVAQRLQEGAARYLEKYGQAPNLALVNEGDAGVAVGGLTVKIAANVRPNQYKLGRE